MVRKSKAGAAGVRKRGKPTAFQNRVYDACRCIPRGKVSTYGALATALGSAPRAVGQALRCNPFAPEVPCHRVIASTLDLGGFSGHWGFHCETVQKKKAMLESEGVNLDRNGKLVDAQAQLMDATQLKEALNKSKRFTCFMLK